MAQFVKCGLRQIVLASDSLEVVQRCLWVTRAAKLIDEYMVAWFVFVAVAAAKSVTRVVAGSMCSTVYFRRVVRVLLPEASSAQPVFFLFEQQLAKHITDINGD